MARLLQDGTEFRAGWTQPLFDAALSAAALRVLDLETVVLSALGAVVLNLVIALNRRRARYVAA